MTRTQFYDQIKIRKTLADIIFFTRSRHIAHHNAFSNVIRKRLSFPHILHTIRSEQKLQLMQPCYTKKKKNSLENIIQFSSCGQPKNKICTTKEIHQLRWKRTISVLFLLHSLHHSIRTQTYWDKKSKLNQSPIPPADQTATNKYKKVLPQSTTHSLVVHIGFVLMKTPESGNSLGVHQFKNTLLSVCPLNIAWTVLLVLQ